MSEVKMDTKETQNDLNPILEVNDLYVSYGAVEAIHGVSLHVNKGELVSICGVNGAGKSTVLKSIAGVLKPKSGTIRFKQKDVTGRKPEQLHKIGMALVPEGRDIFPTLTVGENLRIGAYGRYKPKTFAADLEVVFELFPILKERYDQAGGLLSGGEQQMLAIARGLISRPDLLMMDEPSLGLSPTRVDQIFELILELKGRGITILLVEQNAKRALEIADRAYLFSNGRVEYAGCPKDMESSIDIAAVYLGENKGGNGV